MAISLIDNLKIQNKKQNVERDSFATIADMVSYSPNYLPNIFHAMCEETGKMYVYNINNDEDPDLGKWRVLEGSGSGTSITVDSAMSDTSTNPVQNKVIKAYVDSKSVDISADLDNAIQNKTDGIYVEKTKISTDDGNALSKKSNGLFVQDLSDKINQINFAQKTVNEGLDYCYCTLGDAISGQTYSINDTFPFTMSKSNNMTCNSSNHSIILKKGKTYRISSDIQCNLTSGSITISIYNLTKGMNLTSFHKTVNNTASESAGTAIYTPDLDDEEIIVKITSLTGKANGTKKPTDFSYFIAEEIGRAITIDPLEYVNTTQGIEDTPVGHIIHYMGNNAPKHYLICDGGEYNIVDYPYLAQHFKDEFGSSNFFGGDGTTTFAVPEHEIVEYKSIIPAMSSNEQDGYVASASSIYDDEFAVWKVFNKTATDSIDCWSTEVGNTTAWVQIQLPTPIPACSFSITSRNTNNGNICSINNFELLGSNDGENWDELFSIINESRWAIKETRTYYFSNKQSYLYYRLNVSKSSGTTNSTVLIAEFDLFAPSQIDCIKYEPTYFMKNTYSADSVNYTDEEIQEAVAAVLGGGN